MEGALARKEVERSKQKKEEKQWKNNIKIV